MIMTKELPPSLRKGIGHSLSAIRQAQNTKLKSRWTAGWAKSPRFHRLRFKDVLTPHSQKYLKYISNGKVSRKTASTIFQLRVGHAPLNDYLHRFKKVESAQCPACGHPKETPEHYLLHCPSYDHECWPILNQSGGRRPTIANLLSSPKMLVPLANFMEATERFELDQS